jgi:hypothetical protein
MTVSEGKIKKIKAEARSPRRSRCPDREDRVDEGPGQKPSPRLRSVIDSRKKREKDSGQKPSP